MATVKRPRPHIPDMVKCNVAGRQILAAGINIFAESLRDEGETLRDFLERRLHMLSGLLGCKRSELHLDHDPPLRVRDFNKRTGKYTPDANDPAHLIYRTAVAHRFKTNVKGDGAQFPDRVLINRERKRDRQKMKIRCSRCLTNWRIPPSRLCGRCLKVAVAVRDKLEKKWPKRKMQSASNWPKRSFGKRQDHDKSRKPGR